jgi:hypothetical protein
MHVIGKRDNLQTFSGLMGNYNGDITDDFVLPDGSSAGNPTALTEQQVYTQFGNQCK